MPDYNLKLALNKIKSAPFNFALIEGKKSDQVLVTPKPPPGKLLDDTKKECGDGKRVAKGIVLKEEGQIVFATRGAPLPAWKATLKKIFQEQKCSMFLPIELRQLRADESEEVQTEESETPSELPAGDPLSTGIAAPPQTTAAPKPASISPPPGSGPKPPSPQPPSPLKPAAGKEADLERLLTERYLALNHKFMGTKIADHAVKKELSKLFDEAKQLGSATKFEELKARLDRIDGMLNQVATAGSPRFNEAEFRKQWLAAKQAWQAASQSADAQIARLQAALKKYDDPQLHEIAEFGLNGVTGGHKVPLMAILVELDAASGATLTKLAAKAIGIIAGFQNYLRNEDKVAACDENPFGVTLTIRDSLGAGLRQLDQALRTAGNG